LFGFSWFDVCSVHVSIVVAAPFDVILFDWAFKINSDFYAQDYGPVGHAGFDGATGLGTLAWTTSAPGSNNFIAFLIMR